MAGSVRSELASRRSCRSAQRGRNTMVWSTVIRTTGATKLFAVVHSTLATLSATRKARRLAGACAADGLFRIAFTGSRRPVVDAGEWPDRVCDRAAAHQPPD